jgi:hypothetical protein
VNISQTSNTRKTSQNRRRLGRITGAALAAVLATSLVPLTPVEAATAGIGPVDATGFPSWFSDGTNQLALCLSGPQCLATPVTGAVSFPDNFPDEAFWFAADAAGGNLTVYRAGIEASFVNAPSIVDGEQMGFSRQRFKIKNLVTGASYRIQHPYGDITFVAEHDPSFPNDATIGWINQTLDGGACAPTPGSPCNWAGVGAAFLGDFTATTAAFLTQANRVPGMLGDATTPGPVTGAPSGVNAVIVTGPNAGGPGNDILTVTDFAVQGLISTAVPGAPTTPDLVSASDSGRSPTDNITNVTTPSFAGTTDPSASVDLLVDGAATVAATTTATAAGAYSVTLPTLTDGTHTVQARTAGLTSGTLTFVVDTTGPAVTIVAPFPSTPSADNTPTLSFAGEADTRFECELQPSNPGFTACVSPHTFDAQVNGPYTFNVRGTDVAGNVSPVATRALVIGPIDVIAPTVLTKIPANGATVVSQTANLTATFSENVTGVSDTTFTLKNATTGTPVPATVTYAAPGIATLNPTATLTADTRYTATLGSGIVDGFSLPVAPQSWSFATGPRPTITSRIPSTTTNISQLKNLGATFNRIVTGVNSTTFTLRRGSSIGTKLAAVVSYNTTTRVATLNPTVNLAPATKYTATLSSGIKDLVGNALAPTSWSFTTGPRPTVLSVSPLSNATGVSRITNVAARFSENVRGINRTTVYLRRAGSLTKITAVVSYNSSTHVTTLNPSVTLAGRTKYTATLSSLINDVDGNRITTKSWSFTTRS